MADEIMTDEIKEAPASIPTPAPKPEVKPEKVKVKLIGAGSVNVEGIILKKNEVTELEASQAERFIKSGLFVKV